MMVSDAQSGLILVDLGFIFSEPWLGATQNLMQKKTSISGSTKPLLGMPKPLTGRLGGDERDATAECTI